MKYVRKWWKSPLQGKVRFRSSYELAYAKYLDKNGVVWLYESILFQVGNKEYYLPDFYLPKRNTVVEVKGVMTKKAQSKIDRFKKLYKMRYQLLYREDLLALGCDL